MAFVADRFAIGSNPAYLGGPESLAAQLADLRFFLRAFVRGGGPSFVSKRGPEDKPRFDRLTSANAGR